MSKKAKIIVSISGIVLVMLILLGLTYAYFLTRIQGNTNDKSISVTTANLELTYADGNGTITSNNIMPGTTLTDKEFTVTNDGNATVNNYAVYLEELVNELTRSDDMVYTLTCTSSKENGSCAGKSETTFPKLAGIIVTNSIDVGETQTYKLTVTYKEMNVDQSEDMNKKVSARVQIYNLQDIVDVTGTVTNASAGDYVEMHSNPKASMITTDNKYLIAAVEPGTHTIYVKDKEGTVKGSKEITIKKGSTASVSGTNITVTNDSQTVNVDIKSIASTLTINIGETKDYMPFDEGTLASAIYISAKTKANGTELLSSPRSRVAVTTSQYGTGKFKYETVTTGSLCAGYNAWLVGDNGVAAKSGSTVSSYDEAVGKYVYDQCSGWTKKLLSYNSTNNTLTFGIDEIKSESTLSIAEDDYGTTYYYRGAVTDNYVSFADKLWRIVRINGDGTIRLVLDDVAKDSSGSVIETSFNSNTNDNAYVGYMYGIPGSTTYDDTHKNINDSTIKTKVDKWYEDNLKTNYANYLSDTLFCNDKTLASSTIGSNNTALGYGTNITYYASTERLLLSTGTTTITTSKPTFKCAESATNDYSRFTVNVATLSNGNKTNGNLKYPIGLLSADEVSFAGAYKIGQLNKSYYLYNSSITSNWWLSSPEGYGGSNAFEWYVYGSNGFINTNLVNYSSVLRPSINLKASVLVGGGDGTSENPYTVKIS